MNNLSNLKDTITTIAGSITIVAGAILGMGLNGVVLPKIVIIIASTLVVTSVALSQYLTGKAPNGTTKTIGQLITQNSPTPVAVTPLPQVETVIVPEAVKEVASTIVTN